MDIYIVHIRPIFAKKGETALFITNDGEAFQTGTIGHQFTDFWEKSGVKVGQQVTHTLLRKFIATETINRQPESAAVVQKVMSHSPKTAQRSYMRTQCTTVAAEAMAAIRRVTSQEARENVHQSLQPTSTASSLPPPPQLPSSRRADNDCDTQASANKR